jgi:hypothetical protein
MHSTPTMVMLHADAAMQISSGKEATTERINRLNLLIVPLVYATTNQTAQDNTKMAPVQSQYFN